MDAARIFIALFGLIIPIKAAFELLRFLILRGLQRRKDPDNLSAHLLEFLKLPLILARPRGQWKDFDGPPLVRKFLADYGQRQPSEELSPEVVAENEAGPSGSRISSARTIVSIEDDDEGEVPRPRSAPLWGDFAVWYSNRFDEIQEVHNHPEMPENDEPTVGTEEEDESCFPNWTTRWFGNKTMAVEMEQNPENSEPPASASAVVNADIQGDPDPILEMGESHDPIRPGSATARLWGRLTGVNKAKTKFLNKVAPLEGTINEGVEEEIAATESEFVEVKKSQSDADTNNSKE